MYFLITIITYFILIVLHILSKRINLSVIFQSKRKQKITVISPISRKFSEKTITVFYNTIDAHY